MSETIKDIETVETAEKPVDTVDNVKVEEEKKPYEFRQLGSKDVILMSTIISKVGINKFIECISSGNVLDTIKNMTSEEQGSEDGAMIAAGSVFLEIANVVLGNLHKCENEIYQMLSQTSNLTVEEITAEGNALMFVEMVIDFIKKPEFKGFIKVVSKLLK